MQLEAAFFHVDSGQVLVQGLDLEVEQLEVYFAALEAVFSLLEADFACHLEAVMEAL